MQNVTIDPLDFAMPADTLAVSEVLDLQDGIFLNAREFISSRSYARLIETRVNVREALQREKPLLACAICGTSVYIVAHPNKRFFFRHTYEDGSCCAHTRGGFTEAEIRARKYHGLRESDAHRRLKALIERSLRADPAFLKESISVETRWKATKDPKLWRQPDVQARSGKRKFAFEAQLSTTFLDVVVSRRLFYEAEDATLIWILAQFSPDYRRMTTDDLLFSNNSNIFVVDEETVELSESENRFYLRCHFRRPFFQDGKILERWDEALVRFNQLQHDHQCFYFFDHDAEEKRLRILTDKHLCDDFFALWLDMSIETVACRIDKQSAWTVVRNSFASRGINIPRHPDGDASFRSMIHGVMSAIKGVPVGWKFTKLVQVAHLIAEDHPENLVVFGFALKFAGHEATIVQQDSSGKWKKKASALRLKIHNREDDYLPSDRWLPALRFLFPEVGVLTDKFLANGDQQHP